ncbi:MAG: UDP-N-acetylglucosamine 2-epimerase (non-hydrolyzing), partial [Dokdonella sp.]
FSGFGALLDDVKPATVVVQGDTATVAVAAWAAFLARIEVAHVEAGLRSHDKWQPFPEEINRRITGGLADWHFAPTPGAVTALRHEHVAEDRIVLAGNTVVDALQLLRSRLGAAGPPLGLDPQRPLMIATIHRRENFGAPLQHVCDAIQQIAARHPALQIVLPLHPNPDAGRLVREQLQHLPSVTLCEALGYEDFVRLMLNATVALSDSGGIQEEGPALGLPVLVLREVTERPEGVTAGSVRLIGTASARIVAEVDRLLTDDVAYRIMATPRQVYGDGLAAERIADVLTTGTLQRAPFQPA